MHLRLLLTVFLAWFLMGPAMADGRVPLPLLSKAIKGERCVEDTSFMRRNHMELLKHQRDKTMQQGIRTQKHSLKNCINCHVSTRPDGTGADIKSRDHFCNSCHAYVAVKLDCFECHATQPDGDVATIESTTNKSTR